MSQGGRHLERSELTKLIERCDRTYKLINQLKIELSILESGDEKKYLLNSLNQFRMQLKVLNSRTKQLTMQNNDLKESIKQCENELKNFDEKKQSEDNNNNNNNNNIGNDNRDPEWYKNKSLRLKCECEMCRLGLATTHNDESHDQSLYGKFILATDNRFQLSLIGGSTKCGRIMSNYFGYLINKKKEKLFENSKIIEVGSGTGIVGFTLAYLTNQNNQNVENKSEIMMTDQSGVLDILQENRKQLIENIEPICGFKFNDNIKIGELLWGKNGVSPYLNQNYNILVGSDLIYAKEGIEPLVTTFELLSDNPIEYNKQGKIGTIESGFKHPIVYMAIIRRFKWEEMFFDLMKNKFIQENVLTDGDIALYRYIRKEDATNN